MKDKEIQEKASFNLQLQNNKKAQKIKEHGITLIALVVTIILLLILAGVTISQIAGSNGLFQRTRQAVEKYKNSAEEEQIQIGMLEQYVTDFSVVGGDEGENKASVEIKTLTVSGDAKEHTITVKLTIEGQASKIEYSINNGNTWEASDEISEDKTEYTYTFGNLDLGKSYYVRVKVYDTDGKYAEAISDIVTLSNEMTATVADVLSPKTFLAKDGSVLTGTMPSIGAISGELIAGGKQTIQAGYTRGGTITAKDLASQTPGTATAEQILYGKSAYVNGTKINGNMKDKSGQTVIANSVTTSGNNLLIKIPENGFYNNNSSVSINKNELGLASMSFLLGVYGEYTGAKGSSFEMSNSPFSSVKIEVSSGSIELADGEKNWPKIEIDGKSEHIEYGKKYDIKRKKF